MDHLIFGHSFAVPVALVLLSVLAFIFLYKKISARRNIDIDMSTGKCYDVFLSFRGPDTREGFTDHLYNALVDAGIDAFRDDDELCYGKDIRPVLMEAITSSKILIPIFSVNYGTSSWCLDELVQIMERKNNNGQMVLPIFYKVKPADVGHQIGSFGKAFHRREKRLLGRSSFDVVTLKKWKKALLEVSTLKGYQADGSEVELVTSIVRKVLIELKKKFELIGIDGHVKKVMEFLDNKSHDTLFVGIHGMGGIGKTTLAKAIYNKLSDQFEYCSFIADIRESWKCNGVHYLQNQLICDILKQENEVCNEDEVTKSISSMFKGKKVLVLLDDVDDVIQLKHLAGNHGWFSSGSRIIITTRNKGILKEAGVDYNYEHEVMDDTQSLILFSNHAFLKNFPLKEFEDLAREVVSIAKGLPLSLEVLGSLLCARELAFWRGTIEKLKKVPRKEVQGKLRISIEELDYEQKQIFLDIACFFIGIDKNITSYMWDACEFFPEKGITLLIIMSLIKVGNDHKLRMHDQLRDLGREIVHEENQREPWCRSRLWNNEEAHDMLKENKGTDKIEGINLSEGSSKGSIYTAKQFKNLSSLRFLHLNGAHLSGDFKDSMEKLRWLRWPYCPMNFEVNNIHARELLVLELPRSKINEKWEGWSCFMVAEQLKYLDLSYCYSLENTYLLSAFKKLEVLILNGCRRLKRLDASIGDMKALLRLELRGCASLTELPTEVGKLKALQQLHLENTRSLFALPNSMGFLENLKILEISASGIEQLPDSIGRLTKLRKLRAFECSNLKGEIVESMYNLSSLQHLDFRGCHSLQSLPELPSGLTYLGVTCRSHKLPSLSHLAHLKVLQVGGCEFLEYIQELPPTLLNNLECSQATDVKELKSPQSLNTPFKLEFLGVSSCRSIKTLDISQFINLRTLSIQNCENLLEVRVLDKLIYLECLTVAKCNSIERLELPKFKGLKKLDARYCKKLAKIQGLDRSEYLERLDIQGCTSIERLDLPKSGRLKELKAGGCKNLAEFEDLDRLEFLERLDIFECTSIKRLDFPKSRRLKELKVGGYKNLAEIEGFDGLEDLERLDIEGCTLIERLDLPKSWILKELKAGGCKKLSEIQDLDRSEYLEMLDIEGCTSIERLNLPKSWSLKELKAKGCKKLAEIQGLDRSEYLETLDIEKCTSIERLDLLKSRSLKELKAGGCKKLVEIQGLDSSEYLERLDIEGCTSIERLYLPKSRRLKELKAEGCKELAEIQGLDGLEFLERLDISKCTSIGRLLLPKSGRLKELKAKSCKNLAEIQGLYTLEFLERLDISKCT